MTTAVDWAGLKPKSVGTEDALGESQNKQTWEKLYGLAGAASADEAAKQGIRLAVYAYCCVNGTSREGAYEAMLKTATGLEFSASVIPQAASRMSIRKFLRANIVESYTALKESGIIEENERYVAKVSLLGISASCAFATADWMGDCPLFTPMEVKAHEISFNVGLERSRRSRGGVSLEAVERKRVDATMEAQGSMESGTGPVVF